MKHNRFYYLLVIIIVGIDQATKAIVVRSLAYLSSKSVVPGFFNITHIRNRGAIFGFFSQSESLILFIFLTTVSLVALGFVIFYFFKTPASDNFMKISLSLILAGALGNLTDRVIRGYVVDFLDFYVKSWHWPSFNIADSSITVGALVLIFILLFKRRPKCSPSS